VSSHLPRALQDTPAAARERAEGGRACVGQIGAPHGVRGELWLHSFTEDPLAIAQYGPLEAEDRAEAFEITAVRRAPKGLIARIAGVADRNAARRLAGLRLYIARARLPKLEEADTFYHADLVGLAVNGPDGCELGVVRAVHDFGAGAILEIAPGSGPSVMVPFCKAAVPTVDMRQRCIMVSSPIDTSPAQPTHQRMEGGSWVRARQRPRRAGTR
jgi:16S rRNA processing protein RimM